MNFDITRVINRAFAPLAQNPVVFFGLSFLFAGLGGAAGALLQNFGVTGFLAGGVSGTAVTLFLAALLIPLITGALNQAALIFAAVRTFNGDKASIGESLSKALPHLLPVIIISLLSALAIGLGFLLLIIPGIFLAVAWSVVVPVRVAEGRGIFASFGRSRDLTRGYFWAIFGLYILLILVSLVAGGVLGALGLDQPPGKTAPAQILGAVVINTFTGALYSAGAASLYYELRQIKEGGTTEEVVEVFA